MQYDIIVMMEHFYILVKTRLKWKTELSSKTVTVKYREDHYHALKPTFKISAVNYKQHLANYNCINYKNTRHLL